MKKLFAIAILGSVVLVSCKKSSGGSAPLQATINGTVTNFGTDASGLTTSSSGEYIITIEGATGTASISSQLGVTISSTSPIVAGTYTDTTISNFGGIQYVPSSTAGSSIFGSAAQKSHPTTVVVTSVSSTQIVGTFQGTIYAGQDTTTTPTTITNGTFNVKLTAQ
jgi:hypothetical protein